MEDKVNVALTTKTVAETSEESTNISTRWEMIRSHIWWAAWTIMSLMLAVGMCSWVAVMVFKWIKGVVAGL